MSHRICNKNIERDALAATIKVLESTPESEETNARKIKGMKQQLAAKTNTIESKCPMCHRIFHPGDTLCHCAPAMEKSLRVPGQKRVKGYKCLIRVNDPLISRHGIRAAMVATKRLHRKNMALLHRESNVLKYEGQVPKGAAERY